MTYKEVQEMIAEVEDEYKAKINEAEKERRKRLMPLQDLLNRIEMENVW